MRADIVPGAVLPDSELTDHAAKRRKLSYLEGPDPMIVVLSRETFCPKDRSQAVGYCRLVIISTDNLLATSEYRTGVGVRPFLSDPARIVHKNLDILEYTNAVNNPMIPHTILRQGLRAVSKNYRPDSDIRSPELRAAWTEGEKHRFYPYSKSYAKVFGEQN